MSYTDRKITQEEINAHHVQGATDYLIGNPQQNKAVFDDLPEFIAGKFNDLIDEIAGQHGDEIKVAVDEWLAEHPEATTTVQDNSLTTAKYVDGSVTEPKIANGAVTPSKLDRAYSTTDDLASVNANLTNEINVLDSRMDEFASLPEGSTTADAELADIRVGADGITYPTAGDAVRGQVADLKSDLSEQRRDFDVVANVVANLFDGNYKLGYAILSDGTFNVASNAVTAIIPCKPNTTYFLREVYTTHNRWVIATSANALPIGQAVDIITPASENPSTCWEVHTGATAKYLFVYVSNQNETPTLWITKEEVFDFVSYDSPINADLSAEVSHNLSAHTIKALSSEYLINLFDGNYIDDIGLLGLGVVPGNGLYTNVNGSRTIIVPVKPNTTYYFRSFDAHNRIRYGTSNKFPIVGDTVYIDDGVAITGNYSFSYTTNSTANWLIITVTNQSDEPRVQITEDIDSVTFIGYNSIKPKDGEIESYTKWFFLDDIEGVFDTDVAISALDASTTRIADIYSIYDALVTNHSDYVSKTVLGTVSTENLEMRKYTFNSLSIQNNSAYSLKKPKLVFIAGIHGYEQGSSYCLAKVMEQLANGTDSISKFIRDNVEIVIVPVANPYGYNHNQRKNENGVDLNRNFEAGWTATGSPSADYYGGASANSEEETQILTTLLDDNDDAYYAVDFHNIANGYPLMYLYTDVQTQFCNSLFVTLTNKWVAEYTGFPTGRLLGYCNTGVNACFAKQALSIGIDSFVAEAPWIMPVIGSSQYDVPTLTIGADVFGNIVAMLAKSML